MEDEELIKTIAQCIESGIQGKVKFTEQNSSWIYDTPAMDIAKKVILHVDAARQYRKLASTV